MGTSVYEPHPLQKPRGAGGQPSAIGQVSSRAIRVFSAAPACSRAAAPLPAAAAAGPKAPLITVLASAPVLPCPAGFRQLNNAGPAAGRRTSGRPA